MQLPLLPWDIASQKWKSIIDPVLANQLLSGQQITQKLAIGANVIYHSLGQNPTGWIVADKNAQANIYRSQPFNPKTLILTSDAVVTVSIWIY